MKSRGYILILTMTVMAVLMIFAIAYVNYYRGEKSVAMGGEHAIIAAAAADAGIQDAISRIKVDRNWQGTLSEKLPRSGATYNVTFEKGAKPYSTNNCGGSSTINTGWPGDRQVPAGMVHLVSVGKFQNATRIEEAMITIGIGNPFPAGATVQDAITLNGQNVVLDFFDSSNGGTYEKTRISDLEVVRKLYETDPDKVPNLLLTNTISTDKQHDVSLIGGASVIGTITVGSGGDPAEIINGVNYVSPGRVATSPTTIIPFPAPSLPQGDPNKDPLPPGTYGELNIKNNLTLLPGKYVINGNLTLSGNVNILNPQTGRVEIYVNGDIDIGGNSCVNENTKASTNLIIYGGPGTKSVKVSGTGSGTGSNLYCGIHAPNAEIKITGNVQVFGAVTGYSLDIGGTAKLHYDLAFKSFNGGEGTGSVSIKSRW